MYLKTSVLCDPKNLRALERLCDDASINTIVVSSSWRTGCSVDELRFLQRMDHLDTPAGRTEAIDTHEVQRFLVLDDFHLAPMSDGIVIRCDPFRGLTDSDVPAIVLFQYQLPCGLEKASNAVAFFFVIRMHDHPIENVFLFNT